MIIKIIRIFLVVSCALQSSIVFAQTNTTEEAAVIVSSRASTIVLDKKLPLEALIISRTSVNEKSIDEKSIDEKSIDESSTQKSSLDKKPTNSLLSSEPQVGKHVMTNMNAGSMILSLLMVLGLIIVCAFVLKRFNLTQQSVSQLKVVTSLRLSAKERVIVVQVGDQQLLLGVTGQKITLLDKLSEPLISQSSNYTPLPKNILSFLSPKKRND